MVKSGMQTSVMSYWDAKTQEGLKVRADPGVGCKWLRRLAAQTASSRVEVPGPRSRTPTYIDPTRKISTARVNYKHKVTGLYLRDVSGVTSSLART